jgi:hypothetical protein
MTASDWLLLALVIATYFLPTIIAASRDHQSTAAIFVVNLLAGWTGLAWLVAFIWSLTGTNRQRVIVIERNS